jgi:hypothetical protein
MSTFLMWKGTWQCEHWAGKQKKKTGGVYITASELGPEFKFKMTTLVGSRIILGTTLVGSRIFISTTLVSEYFIFF